MLYFCILCILCIFSSRSWHVVILSCSSWRRCVISFSALISLVCFSRGKSLLQLGHLTVSAGSRLCSLRIATSCQGEFQIIFHTFKYSKIKKCCIKNIYWIEWWKDFSLDIYIEYHGSYQQWFLQYLAEIYIPGILNILTMQYWILWPFTISNVKAISTGMSVPPISFFHILHMKVLTMFEKYDIRLVKLWCCISWFSMDGYM